MQPNSLTLIRELENTASLDGRFTGIEVANRDRATGAKLSDGGALSVVFKATDTVSEELVAIKFFDPDCPSALYTHRFEQFKRESKLLDKVKGKDRCLQQIQSLNVLSIAVTDPTSGNSLSKDFIYFITEWLDYDLLPYFLDQQRFDAREKLELFREMVLSVFALHNVGIYHRDLKRDNFRLTERGLKKIVVAIDLGTAAKYDSAPVGVLADYSQPVGAPRFAPLEARCGLSGIRKLGPYGDIYTLGYMFHDLFHADTFFFRQIKDAGYQSCAGACFNHMASVITPSVNEHAILNECHKVVGLSKLQVVTPSFSEAGSSAPRSIRGILDRLLKSLISVDYRDRLCDPNKVLRCVDTALKILINEQKYVQIYENRRKRREQRREKRLAREQRLLRYLQMKNPKDAI